MVDKTVTSARSANNRDEALRAVSRGVIRRVCQEHPQSDGYDLFLRLCAADPFPGSDVCVQQLWFDEVIQAVGGVGNVRSFPLVPTGKFSGWLQ